MSTFQRVYKPYFRGEGGGENQHFFCILLAFGMNFIILMGIFGIPKMLMCTLFFFLWGGGRVQKVHGFYTHENVDIYGRPLSLSVFH